MKRINIGTFRVLLWFAAAILTGPFVLAADENTAQHPQYDLSSHLPGDSGISTWRYATSGFGRYPYMLSMPGATVRVSLDGVELGTAEKICKMGGRERQWYGFNLPCL